MSSFLEVVEFIEDANSSCYSIKIQNNFWSISVAGIVLNSILLIAIKRFSRPQLGTYKHLLTIFASVDIFLVILHNVVHPVSSTYTSLSIDIKGITLTSEYIMITWTIAMIFQNVMRVGNIHCVVTDTVFDDKVVFSLIVFFLNFYVQ